MAGPEDSKGIADNEIRVGWPRPWLSYRMIGRQQAMCRVPQPWINVPGNLLEFHADCGHAHTDRLCAICGEVIVGSLVLGHTEAQGKTNGPGCHPRCFLLALAHCPHLKEHKAIVGYRWDGDGPGYRPENEPDTLELYGQSMEVEPTAIPLTRKDCRELAKSAAEVS